VRVQSLPLTAPRLTCLMAAALFFGGLFWAIDFVLIILNGMVTGSLPAESDAQLPLYLRVGLRLFIVSIPILTFGLAMLAIRLRAGSPKLTVASLLFMTIALVLSSVNLVTISGLASTPMFNDTFMGLSIFATAIATGFLGAATLRTQTLSRVEGVLLLLVGVTTIPILFGTPLPFGPDWATDHLAFLTSGSVYAIVGVHVWMKREA
jgi:hypothetical protein